MAINPVPVTIQPRSTGTLDTIASGLDIIAKTLGIALEVPKFMQEQKLSQAKIDELNNPTGERALRLKNLESDIATQEADRAPLSGAEVDAIRKANPGLTESMLPITKGQAREFANRQIITPAQQESISLGKERLSLAQQTAEEARAERERKKQEANATKFLAGNFGSRMLQAEKNFSDLEKNGFDRSTFTTGALSVLPSGLQPGKLQQQRQAEINFASAVLRRESGAAIAPSEYENAEKQYFPRAGDSIEVLKQKKENRRQAIQSILSEAGPEVRKQVLKDEIAKLYDDLIHGQMDATVHMKNKDGKSFNIPASEVDEALADGLVKVK